MQGFITFLVFVFVMVGVCIFLNYLVWIKYPTFLDWLIKAYNFAGKLHLPLTPQSINYVKSPAYKWIARFILLFGLIVFLMPIVLMVIFQPWK